MGYQPQPSMNRACSPQVAHGAFGPQVRYYAPVLTGQSKMGGDSGSARNGRPPNPQRLIQGVRRLAASAALVSDMAGRRGHSPAPQQLPGQPACSSSHVAQKRSLSVPLQHTGPAGAPVKALGARCRMMSPVPVPAAYCAPSHGWRTQVITAHGQTMHIIRDVIQAVPHNAQSRVASRERTATVSGHASMPMFVHPAQSRVASRERTATVSGHALRQLSPRQTPRPLLSAVTVWAGQPSGIVVTTPPVAMASKGGSVEVPPPKLGGASVQSASLSAQAADEHLGLATSSSQSPREPALTISKGPDLPDANQGPEPPQDIQCQDGDMRELLVPSDASPPASSLTSQNLEVGDLVSLGANVGEHRGCDAVVTKVHEAHCTVSVLDEERQVVIGECWPSFCDLRFVSSAWRLNTSVIVEGLKGAKTKEFNGAHGIVVAHPKQGHPCFVEKASAPGAPRLTLCISVRAKESGRHPKQVLLEPRFLVEREEHFSHLAQGLAEQAAAALEPSGSPRP